MGKGIQQTQRETHEAAGKTGVAEFELMK